MSGMGGGGGSTHGGSRGGDNNGVGGSGFETDGGVVDCTKLIENTVLNSPSPDVLKRLNPNDILAIQLLNESPPRVVAIYDDEFAGSITIRSLAKLIECLQQGFSFIALVKEVDGGMCRVQIRPESKI